MAAAETCGRRDLSNALVKREGEPMTTIRPVLHHVTMRTSRVSEMVNWYSTVLGAHVMFRNERAAWMTNDEANHRVAFLSAPDITDDETQSQRDASQRVRVR